MQAIPNKHYKYIHIFHRPDTFNSLNLVKLIRDFSQLEPEEHLFVTQHEDVYKALKPYGNVYLYENSHISNYDMLIVKMINQCGKWGDWIFLHALLRPVYVVLIKKTLFSKMIWRTWGHDVGFPYYPKQLIKNTIKFLIKPIWTRRLKELKAVGGANVVDKINLQRFSKRFFVMNYTNEILWRQVLEVKRNNPIHQDDFQIMVGHSGTSMDNHFEMVKKLERWKGENIHIYIMFPYYGLGDIPTLNQLKEYASSIWNQKITFIEHFVPGDQYCRFINSMDAIILDGVASYALGNIGLAVSLHKKIFLNRNGAIRKGFDAEKIPYCCTDEIDDMKYEDFIKPFVYREPLNSSIEIHGCEYDAQKWRELLDWLEERK